MSGSSPSRSSNSQTLTTTNNTSLQGISGTAQLINGDGNTLTDHGAVEKAFDFSKHAYDESSDLLKTGLGKSLDFNEKVSQNALNFAANVSKPSDERTIESIIKYGGIALIGLVVAKVFNNVWGSQ